VVKVGHGVAALLDALSTIESIANPPRARRGSSRMFAIAGLSTQKRKLLTEVRSGGAGEGGEGVRQFG
jgi:hypothetical protein